VEAILIVAAVVTLSVGGSFTSLEWVTVPTVLAILGGIVLIVANSRKTR
jgi:hypothetical protein